MTRHVFTPADRAYATWSFCPPLADDGLVCPLAAKLLVGDVVTSSAEIDRCSRYRELRSIPGVLCLSRGTHGRSSNGRQLYRCVPADPKLPVFLVPYTQKKPEFGKAPIDLYILFEFAAWTDRHPTGSSTNTLGKVNDLETTYSYLTHARDLHRPIQKFTRQTFNAIRAHPEGAAGLEDSLAAELSPALPEGWGRLITIDPDGATDLDDAIAAVELPDGRGFRVSVCITDPTYWLERLGLWGSLTDKTTTLYLPSGRRPMLPPNLSEGLCSLQSGKPRAALLLQLQMNAEGKVTESRFLAGSVRIEHNYVYEQPALLTCDTYRALWNATLAAQNTDSLLEAVEGSHDVVAYWMMKYNLLAACALDAGETGMYRSVAAPRAQPSAASALAAVPDAVPVDTRRLLRYWGAAGGAYTDWKDRAPHGAVADGKRLYVQATSPIRRIIDLVNTVALQRALALRPVSEEAQAFLTKWLGRVDEVQRASKAARKLQSECELLEHCVRAKVGSDSSAAPRYQGVPIEKAQRPAYSETCFRYTVHLPRLRHVVCVDSDEAWELLAPRLFTLHLFVDEARMHRKVRVAPV